MPAALERGGGAVSLSIAKAVILASEKTRLAEALAFAKGLADAFSHPIAEALAHPEVFADSKVIPHPEVLADPEILSDP